MPCISMPTAMLIGGGLSAAGGIASAVIGSNAAQSAAKTQSDAANNQLAQSKEMFNTVQANMKPFMDAGQTAIPGLEALLGNGPNGTAGIMAQLEKTPGYQFALNQGLQATQSGFAAQGLGQSGAAMKGAANYAEGLAENTYSNVFSNFLSTANLGSNASANLASAAGQFQGMQNQLAGTSAAATAAGQVGSANAISSGITNALGGVSNAALMMGMNSGGMFGAAGGNGAPDPWAGMRNVNALGGTVVM